MYEIPKVEHYRRKEKNIIWDVMRIREGLMGIYRGKLWERVQRSQKRVKILMTCQKSIKTYLKPFNLVDQVIIHTLNLFKLYNPKTLKKCSDYIIWNVQDFLKLILCMVREILDFIIWIRQIQVFFVVHITIKHNKELWKTIRHIWTPRGCYELNLVALLIKIC